MRLFNRRDIEVLTKICKHGRQGQGLPLLKISVFVTGQTYYYGICVEYSRFKNYTCDWYRNHNGSTSCCQSYNYTDNEEWCRVCCVRNQSVKYKEKKTERVRLSITMLTVSVWHYMQRISLSFLFAFQYLDCIFYFYYHIWGIAISTAQTDANVALCVR